MLYGGREGGREGGRQHCRHRRLSLHRSSVLVVVVEEWITCDLPREREERRSQASCERGAAPPGRSDSTTESRTSCRWSSNRKNPSKRHERRASVSRSRP